MVKFNELAVLDEGKLLVIDVSILDIDNYFEDLEIDKVYLVNQDTYKDGRLSEDALQLYDMSISDSNKTKTFKAVYSQSEINSLYNVSFNANINGGNNTINNTNIKNKINLKEDLLFVYVTFKGTHSASTPCFLDQNMSVGITFNTCPIYYNIMQCLRETVNDCDIPKNFINQYLRFKALELSIETEHYMEAIEFYNKYFKGKKGSLGLKKCRCHE